MRKVRRFKFLRRMNPLYVKARDNAAIYLVRIHAIDSVERTWKIFVGVN